MGLLAKKKCALRNSVKSVLYFLAIKTDFLNKKKLKKHSNREMFKVKNLIIKINIGNSVFPMLYNKLLAIDLYK